jgi:hypothetical protein
VRLVIEHRGAYAIEYAVRRSITAKLDIVTPETLRQTQPDPEAGPKT